MGATTWHYLTNFAVGSRIICQSCSSPPRVRVQRRPRSRALREDTPPSRATRATARVARRTMSPPAARPRDARRSRRYPSRALVAALLVVAHLALVEASEEEDPSPPRASPSIAACLIPLPADARCPWISDGVVPAARANPLVRAVVQRTRMAAPFGPGSWPRPFVVPSEDDAPRFGWTRAIILVADVRVDPERAAKWLPRSIMDTMSDVARVFVAWCVRARRAPLSVQTSERASGKKKNRLGLSTHLAPPTPHPLPSLSLFQGTQGAGGSRGEDRGDEPVHGDGTRADARGDGAAGVPREGRGVLAQVSVNARGDRRKPASRERAVSSSDLLTSLCASSARSATSRSAGQGFLVEM